MRRRLGSSLWAMLALLLCCSGMADAAGTGVNADTGQTASNIAGNTAGKRQVLVLNSYHQGDPWTDRQVNGIEEVFSALADTELHVEYMDSRRMRAKNSEALLKSRYELKYRGVPIDLIITVDDEALEAIERHREQVFPGVPVVFSGINDFSPKRLDQLKNTTGILENSGYASNLTLLMTLHPGLRHLYIIDDELSHDSAQHKGLDQALAVLDGRISVEYLRSMAGTTLEAQLAALPADSAVFYLTATGSGLSPAHQLPPLSKASTAPIYAAVDYLLGYGIVGGYLKDARKLGMEVGQLGLKILAGTPADSLPRKQMPYSYRFDYRQLKRFDIPLGRLPPHAEVINQPDTFYSRYAHLIWTTLAVLLGLLAYIALLLNSIHKRKRAEQGLKGILDHTVGLLPADASALSAELRSRLNVVLPLHGEIESYYCRHPQPTDPADLADAQPPSPALPCNSVELTRITPQYRAAGRTPDLVQSAATQRRSLTRNRQWALYIASNDLPINLLYGHARSPCKAIDGALLEVFANTTAAMADSIGQSRLLESIDTARRIQQSMLPSGFEALSQVYGIDLNARLLPAKEVSGDLYDVIELDQHRLCLVIGDVSDKGVPSALFMARTVTLIRATAQICGQPEQIVARVNQELCRDNDMSMFVTLFLAVYDRRDGSLSYVNGGHNPPFLLRADGQPDTDPEPLPLEHGLALGVMEEAGYVRQQLRLQPGDRLFAYTDGVTEAMDAQQQQFGEPRLLSVLQQSTASTAAELNNAVLQRADAFVQGAARSDDTTLLCLRRLVD